MIKKIKSLFLALALGLCFNSNALAEENTNEPESDLESLLNTEINTGGVGSFGYRLQDLGVQTYLHGYVVTDIAYSPDLSPKTPLTTKSFSAKVLDDFSSPKVAPISFDIHYFNIFVGANIKNLVNAEMQIEKEHGGDDQQVRFAQLDLLFHPLAIVRLGKFLIPMGTFNEYLYPEYITRGVERPFPLLAIVPVAWPEVGAQIRGKYEFGIGQNINYAFYVVNGLEQDDSDPKNGIDDGGDIRKMRYNHIDANSDDKAFGGRIGARLIPNLDFGVSGYTGGYTIDGKKRLSIFDFDTTYSWEKLSLNGEFVMGLQDSSKGTEIKQGFYVQAAYRLFDFFEPVLQYDTISFSRDTKNNKQRVTLSLNFFPFAKEIPNLVLKSGYSYTIQKDNIAPHKIIVQAAIGF